LGWCWYFGRLELPPAEVGSGVDNNPGDGTPEINDLNKISFRILRALAKKKKKGGGKRENNAPHAL
jgi:hypothetical protein